MCWLQKSACHKHWESTVTYINPSLPKALRANNLLSGNDLSEGWDSQYLGNPRSFSLFLPKKSIKVLPPSAGVSLRRGTSVSLNSSSHSAGSSFSEETLSRKCSYASNQVESNVKRVRYVKNSAFLTETNVSSKPNYFSSDSHLAALEILKKNGAIQVIYPKQGTGNIVNSPASAFTNSAI